VRVYKGRPVIFVPSAFTPNNDGKNDILRPIAAGMGQFEYFNIYNRWGQLIFTTRINGQGWDGKVNGRLQDTGTYVWTVKAVDYTGRSYFEKGLFTLIR
jgi:gliding motility-associated-like protein